MNAATGGTTSTLNECLGAASASRRLLLPPNRRKWGSRWRSGSLILASAALAMASRSLARHKSSRESSTTVRRRRLSARTASRRRSVSALSEGALSISQRSKRDAARGSHGESLTSRTDWASVCVDCRWLEVSAGGYGLVSSPSR